MLDKLVKKMLDRSTLDKGVVNFVVSVLKFVMYAILIMIVVDKLGFQTTSLLTLFGSAALCDWYVPAGKPFKLCRRNSYSYIQAF